jgi:non-specific serine/threonine protein kinase
LLSRDIGARDLIAHAFECLAWVAAADQQPWRAARLAGAAEGLRQALGGVLWPEQRARHAEAVRVARAVLGQESFATAWAEGRALPLDEAIAFALGRGEDSTKAAL